MAKRRKKAGRCARVRYKGGTRTVCRDAKGRIKSVSKASRKRRKKR